MGQEEVQALGEVIESYLAAKAELTNALALVIIPDHDLQVIPSDTAATGQAQAMVLARQSCGARQYALTACRAHVAQCHATLHAYLAT